MLLFYTHVHAVGLTKGRAPRAVLTMKEPMASAEKNTEDPTTALSLAMTAAMCRAALAAAVPA